MSGDACCARSAGARTPDPFRGDLTDLLRLAGPVVISRVGVMTMGLTDAVVVGRYSAIQLGYQALGWSLVSVVVVTAMGLLGGVQVMASRAVGEERAKEAGAALRRGLIYAFWIGVVSTTTLVIWGPALLRVSGIPKDLGRWRGRPVVRALAVDAGLLPFGRRRLMDGRPREGRVR